MEKIRVIIIEDEFVIAEDIQLHLQEAGHLVLDVFDCAEKALPYILENSPDILLVDIHLQGLHNGIWLVREVLKSVSIPVVYITANSDVTTYEEARSTNPHAFLVKPFSFTNLLAAVDLAFYRFSTESVPERIDRAVVKEEEVQPFALHGCLFIRTNGKYKKVCCDDMLFIEAAGSYVHIQTKLDRYTLSHNLSNFQRKTTLPNLARIHRSYIVNMNHIDSFEESYVYIKDHKLPISENFKEEFLTKIRCL